MKKILSLLLVLAMLATVLVACSKEPEDDPKETTSPSTPHVAPKFEDINLKNVLDLTPVTVSDTATDYVLLEIANYGKILIRLFPDVAPETVANFKTLVSQGFYDGLIFHRVIKDFMIQGGDPDGNGTGGSPNNIKGEFKNNGFDNNLKHLRGVVSMARRGDDMNSASSQFFVMHMDAPHLDAQYAGFGKVTEGLDVLDAIASVKTGTYGWYMQDVPKVPVVIEKMEVIRK